MNKPLSGMIATLLIFPLLAVSVPAVSDMSTGPQAKATVKQPPAASAPAPEKAYEPINGAFGLQLGEHFKASMVAKVLSKQEQTYSGTGGTKFKGSLLHIEPNMPDKRFQKYSLKTTDQGIIYAIQGDYQYKKPDAGSPSAEQQESKPEGKGKGLSKPGNKKPANTLHKTCKTAVKSIAKELQGRYGKPRGQGWDGLWFTFRQPAVSPSKGLKLYGHRCRTGMYSIVYNDDSVRRGTSPGKASR